MAWDNGTSNSYRMGADGKFDLRVVESRPTSETSREPLSSVPSEEGHSDEGPSTEEAKSPPPVAPQLDSSSTSKDTEVSSQVLVEPVSVEDIPDEGIFTSDDIFDSPGMETSVIVLEASGDGSAAVTAIDDIKETVGEITEVTDEECITSETVDSTTTETSSTNDTSVNIASEESAERR